MSLLKFLKRNLKLTREERDKLIKFWGKIFGFPNITWDKLRKIGLLEFDEDGNYLGNRLAKGAKEILWLEDLEPKKKQEFFFGNKKKKKKKK